MRAAFIAGLSFAVLFASGEERCMGETFLFTNLNRSIPDGNASGLSDIRTIKSAVGPMSSVRVGLQIVGEYNGDVYGYLRHVSGGTTNFCVLLNRPGKTAANANGYPDSGLDIVLDSAALADIHSYQGTTNPPSGTPLTGCWQPDGRTNDPDAVLDTSVRSTSLSSFSGTDASGEWTLYLADLAGGGTNMLASWSLDISGALRNVSVSGTVTYYGSTAFVPGAQISLGRATNLTATTGIDGSYIFSNVLAGETYAATAAKTNDSSRLRGITSLDCALVQRHVLSLRRFDSPYKLLAADVDGSGGINSYDAALMQRVILSLDQGFSIGMWRFVPANYSFAEPAKPWNAPKDIGFTNLLVDASQGFIGIKLGDVDGSWASAFQIAAKMSKAGLAPVPPMPVCLVVGSAQGGPFNTVTVPINARGLTNMTSLQFSLNWNPAVLRWVGVERCGIRELGPNNFGATEAAKGQVAFAWYDSTVNGVTAADEVTLFTARFEVVGAVGSGTSVSIGDVPTIREVSFNCTRTELTANAGLVTVVEPQALTIEGTSYSEGSFRVWIQTKPGYTYTLEFTDDLQQAKWTPSASVSGDGNPRLLVDPLAITPKRFYRVSANLDD